MESKEKKMTLSLPVSGNFNHKAKHAITTLRNELKKHFRNKECVISPLANEFIWEKGRKNKPSKITLVSVEKNAKVYLFLDSKEDLKRKEEFVLGKKEGKDEKKVEVKGRESDKVQSEENKKEQKIEPKQELKSESKEKKVVKKDSKK